MNPDRKKSTCPNCGNTLGEADNFCSVCGQENNDHNISFWALCKEFLQNYFSFDSRFGRTVKPFLFKPGFLTLQFVKGKRKSFANPIRLYLLLSILFFFMLSMFSRSLSGSDPSRTSVIYYSEEDTVAQSPEQVRERGLLGRVSNSLNWQMMDSLKYDRRYTDKQLLDSMDIDSMSFMEQKTAYQMIKLYRTDVSVFQRYLVNNMPLMMIFVIPILGLLLSWFYYRSRLRYINHLVHSIHLHSFGYLIFSMAAGLGMMFSNDNTIMTVLISAVILVMLYSIFSIRRVYNRKLINSFFRSLLIGFIYAILFVIVLASEIFVSMIIY